MLYWAVEAVAVNQVSVIHTILAPRIVISALIASNSLQIERALKCNRVNLLNLLVCLRRLAGFPKDD